MLGFTQAASSSLLNDVPKKFQSGPLGSLFAVDGMAWCCQWPMTEVKG
jgi:hypothetical protein